MKSQTQRGLLTGFIGSIATCGLVGIYCLLIGGFGRLQGQVLGTTAIVAAASILGLVSAIPWERRRWHPIGPLGLISVAIALALVIFTIWADPYIWRQPWGDNFLKVMGVACVAGVAFPHMGLISLAKLRREYGWVRRATVIAILTLALQAIVSILFEGYRLGDAWWKLVGVVAIFDACGTIAIPILHRVSAIHKIETVKTVELSLDLTCPRCKSNQHLAAGHSACGACGLRFNIEIEEETCNSCGYPLYKLTSPTCPECGTAIDS